MESSTSKSYYKISEVVEMVGVPASTLRFWEGQFSILKPHRNAKGTRYYTPADVEHARMIKFLLHDKGLRIEAAQEEIKINRDGISRKAEAIKKLTDIRNNLQELVDSLHKLR